MRRRLALRSLRPKLRLHLQFIHALNDAADVMTENLAESFVDLGGLRLTSERVAKFRFDHCERRFDIAAFVIVLHEPFLIVAIEVIHAFPH